MSSLVLFKHRSGSWRVATGVGCCKFQNPRSVISMEQTCQNVPIWSNLQNTFVCREAQRPIPAAGNNHIHFIQHKDLLDRCVMLTLDQS